MGQNQRRKQVQAEYFNGKCEELNARYAVADQCDKYVECTDGIPEEKLCSDGLLFNDKAGVFTFPCQYPIDVNCTSRARFQAAQVCIFYCYLTFLNLKSWICNKQNTNRNILFCTLKKTIN